MDIHGSEKCIMAVQKEIDYIIDLGDSTVTGGVSVQDKAFDEQYSYNGGDLGSTYQTEATDFCLWAPTASEAKVMLYTDWQSDPIGEYDMVRTDRGVWRLRLKKLTVGTHYTYKVHVGEDWNEAVDPYARAVSVNGDRGVVVDLTSTNPSRWTAEKPPMTSEMDAIIYEVSVRDLTAHPSSGVKHPGGFLGAAETGAKGPLGLPTGIDHIKSLGVTHVQFMPLYDFSTDSIDETKLDEPHYNWGYDPKNYNVPEGSYATDPYEPTTRIYELKTMIQAYHDQGLRVVMDVVYNHVYDAYRMSFMKLVPGYYYRYEDGGKLADGSGCGNETASERSMVRKFIIDSVLFWAQEYNMDGFRFDLMGLHDIDLMNEVRTRLDQVDPSILLYGEGWHMGTALPSKQKASQWNIKLLPRIGHFNDDLRDTLKGSVFYAEDTGYLNGRSYRAHDVKRGIVGAIPYSYDIQGFALEPNQTINYIECHDNYTLWDKLCITIGHASEEERRRVHRLASAILLTSQGKPFLHAGQEFMRTKSGIENSYRSNIEINWLDWERRAELDMEVEFMKRCIALRKAHSAFRMRTVDQIRERLVFETCPEGAVAYTLRNHANGDVAKHLYVLHHIGLEEIQVELPSLGPWKVIFGSSEVVSHQGDQLTVRALSSVVLCVD